MLARFWLLFRLRQHITLVWRLLRDRRVPLLTKLPIPIALLYVISPVGLLIGVVPLLGQLDDLTVLFLASLLFLRLCPRPLVREHLEEMSGRPPRQPEPKGDVVEGDYKILK